MKNALKLALPLTMGVCLVAFTVGTAQAYVVCNHEGDCWHTDSRYHYHNDVQVEVHPDVWYFHHDWDHDNQYHWRGHHEGRGYWKNGVWVTF